MSLFDADVYLTPDFQRSTRSREATGRAGESQPEPLRQPWIVISTTKGVKPYFHLPCDPETLRIAEDLGTIRGAMLTECGLIGWPITDPGVGSMIRCPECALAE